MKKLILILAALAAWTACAQSARLGSLGRNDMVVTNTVHQSLAPAYSYTDTATNDLAQGMAQAFLPRSYTTDGETVTVGFDMGPGGYTFVPSSMWTQHAYINNLWIVSDNTNGPLSAVGQYGGNFKTARAEMVDYVRAATNALAQTIPQGGGTPEWRVVTEIYNVPFVTNGMLAVTFPDDASVYAITNGWPDGASMFVRATVEGAYFPNTYSDAGAVIKLVGYGMWPTNNFQSVWWRSGTNIYVNVILEE